MNVNKNKYSVAGLAKYLIGVISLFYCTAGLSEWQLDNDKSALFYVSSKASAVSEVNSFHQLSGKIDNDGYAELVIDLASVDSAIEIRNQRLRDILFNVAVNPNAKVSIQLDNTWLESLQINNPQSVSVEAMMSLNGQENSVNADLLVNKYADGSLLVQAIKPVIVNAANYDLSAGIEELREIAGLPSINNNVSVTFSLLFQP